MNRNIKRVLLIPVLLVSFVCTVSAQTGSDKTGALLWKISGNGLEHPSYIFGTHHLFPISFLDSVPGIKQAFASSRQRACNKFEFETSSYKNKSINRSERSTII